MARKYERTIELFKEEEATRKLLEQEQRE